MRPGIWQLVIILLIVLLLFGAKKLPELGGAVGKTIKGFKNSLKDEDAEATPEQAADDAAAAVAEAAPVEAAPAAAPAAAPTEEQK